MAFDLARYGYGNVLITPRPFNRHLFHTKIWIFNPFLHPFQSTRLLWTGNLLCLKKKFLLFFIKFFNILTIYNMIQEQIYCIERVLESSSIIFLIQTLIDAIMSILRIFNYMFRRPSSEDSLNLRLL